MHSFGLLETHSYDQAEKVAMEVRLPISLFWSVSSTVAGRSGPSCADCATSVFSE